MEPLECHCTSSLTINWAMSSVVQCAETIGIAKSKVVVSFRVYTFALAT